MKFHHIGIACRNISKELINIEKLHEVIKKSDIVYDPQQKAELCIVETGLGLAIELISGEPVAEYLKTKGTFYHMCYETENIEDEITKIVKTGGILVSPLKPAVLFGNRRVAFLYVSYGLIELLEAEK